jgi:hypothetical protein
MKPITKIYEKYKIMPTLQEHQLRVAAVAKQICDNLTVPVNEETVIKACLLHDMGNILKFDLTKFPEFLEPEGATFWEGVKKEYIHNFGNDEHDASIAIAKELPVSEEVLKNIDSIGFDKAEENKKGAIETQACAYSDMRVGPYGIISLEERLDDLRKRYQSRANYSLSKSMKRDQALRDIEINIFKDSKIMPKDITNKSVAPIIEQLRTYEI